MTRIEKIIKQKEREYFSFKASPDFYNKVGINSRRWAQIFRGDIEPIISEAKAIAQYFEVDITEII